MRGIPATERVAAHLREELLRGALCDPLPGVHALTAELGANHNSVASPRTSSSMTPRPTRPARASATAFSSTWATHRKTKGPGRTRCGRVTRLSRAAGRLAAPKPGPNISVPDEPIATVRAVPLMAVADAKRVTPAARANPPVAATLFPERTRVPAPAFAIWRPGITSVL